MRRSDRLNVPSVLATLVALAFAAVVGELPELLEAGGWFAVFGQMLAVVAAIAIVVVAAALTATALALPVLALWRLVEPLAALRAERRRGTPMPVLLARALDPAWKAAWRWWRAARRR